MASGWLRDRRCADHRVLVFRASAPRRRGMVAFSLHDNAPWFATSFDRGFRRRVGSDDDDRQARVDLPDLMALIEWALNNPLIVLLFARTFPEPTHHSSG